jgi:hypothetical protein
VSEHPSADKRFLLLRHETWDLLAKLVSVLGVCGVLWGIVEWSANNESDRAKQTLERIEVWTEEGYREDFLALRNAVFAELSEQASAEDLKAASESAAADRNLKLGIVRIVMSDQAQVMKFDRVIHFFDHLGLCIEARLCSSRTAQIFFDDALEGFADLFGPWIERRRQEEPGYAAGLRFLLASIP